MVQITPELSTIFKQGENNSLVPSYIRNFSDLSVEIGDTKDPLKFHPQIKVSRFWNSVNPLGANFSIRLADPDTVAMVENDKIVYRGSVGESRIYKLGDGDFEFDTIFTNSIPSIVNYTLQHKNIVALYQPLELTAQEIADNVTRPDNVRGSYAIYHANARHNEYRTGKLTHIYRPWIEDANGWRVWCELLIDLANNAMHIIIPDDFRLSAILPARLDPTIGNTTAGASNAALSAAYIVGDGPFTPASDGSCASISIYSNETASKNWTAGLYDSAPSALLRDTAGENLTFSAGGSWNALNLDMNYPILSIDSYWLLFGCGSPFTYFFDVGTLEGGFTNNHPYVSGTMPDPITMDNTDWGRIISVFATFSVGPTIDYVTNPVADASAGNTFILSGFSGDATGITLRENVHNIFTTSGVITSGTGIGPYTWNMPDVAGYIVETAGTPFDTIYWTHEVDITDGVDTATRSIVISPKSGWAVRDLAELMNMGIGSVTEGWAGLQADVVSVSIANPSVLNIPGHNFTNGQTVTLFGFTTTPDINGAQVITVIDPDNVSIPVNVTAVTVGTGTALSGAPGEHGQFYYPTVDNTSIAADGTLTTDALTDINCQFFDTVTGTWKQFTIVLTGVDINGDIVSTLSNVQPQITAFSGDVISADIAVTLDNVTMRSSALVGNLVYGPTFRVGRDAP